jgi:hypothetical protein
MRYPGCQHENPAHAKFCLECGTLSFARTSSDSFISTEIRQSVHRPQDAGLG